ncbi:MAG TPA: ATP-dependent DNA helicase RecQ, partial [Thermomicrobiales bacterium]|nr:ATP-dependent DNA helicase RecQ [Thermomicrobiales bacterium]
MTTNKTRTKRRGARGISPGGIRKVARERFGYDELRPGQADAVAAILEGNDTLAVLPTGAGKSAIYQIAAHLIDGPTLVVSPLLALQRDQAESLDDGRAGAAAEINSGVGEKQRNTAFDELAAGDLEFIFLAPEQLARVDVMEMLRTSPPSLVVIDEAHCVSEWGHDFRPGYARLGGAIEALGRPTTLALTATASPPVRAEIIERLGLRDPRIIITGFDRPNIWLGVQVFVEGRDDPDAKREALLERVESQRGSGIVYCATRRHTEEIAEALRARGVSAAAYHAGMGKKDREAVQTAFMDGKTRVIVATSAFGMGIDKADVRFVYHHDITDSVDAYYQEIGRAGRDGEPAEAVLFYQASDLDLRRYFAGSGELDVEEMSRILALSRAHGDPVDVAEIGEVTDASQTRLAQMLNRLDDAGGIILHPTGSVEPSKRTEEPEVIAEEAREAQERHRAFERSRTDVIRGYAETTDCRRSYLLSYLGEPHEDLCHRCDNCANGAAAAEETNDDDAEDPFPVG